MTIRDKDLEEVAKGDGSSKFSHRELAREALEARRETLLLEAELRERCGHGRIGIPELDEKGVPLLDDQGAPKLDRR